MAATSLAVCGRVSRGQHCTFWQHPGGRECFLAGRYRHGSQTGFEKGVADMILPQTPPRANLLHSHLSCSSHDEVVADFWRMRCDCHSEVPLRGGSIDGSKGGGE